MTLRRHKNLLIISLICLVPFFSCRKKDMRYEGTYIGTERHTVRDSGETILSVDTTYVQEFEITYTKKLRGSRSFYTFNKKNNSTGEIWAIDRKSIVDHEYEPFSEIYTDHEGNIVGGLGFLKFSGDSMHLYSSSVFNGEETTFEFNGKRN